MIKNDIGILISSNRIFRIIDEKYVTYQPGSQKFEPACSCGVNGVPQNKNLQGNNHHDELVQFLDDIYHPVWIDHSTLSMASRSQLTEKEQKRIPRSWLELSKVK